MAQFIELNGGGGFSTITAVDFLLGACLYEYYFFYFSVLKVIMS